MRITRPRVLLALLAVAVLLAWWLVALTRSPLLQVASATDMGSLQHPGGPIGDGAPTMLSDGRIAWLFGDTFLPRTAADGARLRSSTVAFADPSAPESLRLVLGDDGLPRQLIPFTADEGAFNAAHDPSKDRIALWPGPTFAAADGGSAFVYIKVVLRGGTYSGSGGGVGIARLAAGSASATRDGPLLFADGGPLFGSAAVVSGGVLYLYGCEAQQLTSACRVARAPLDAMDQRDRYTYWDGSSWQGDIARSSLSLPGSSSGMSVAWNEHLHAYLMVDSEPVGDRILGRTAPAPEGPWSGETTLLSGAAAPPGSWDYIGIQHPELSPDGGRTVVVSYTHPLGPFQSEIRLARVVLN